MDGAIAIAATAADVVGRLSAELEAAQKRIAEIKTIDDFYEDACLIEELRELKLRVAALHQQNAERQRLAAKEMASRRAAELEVAQKRIAEIKAIDDFYENARLMEELKQLKRRVTLLQQAPSVEQTHLLAAPGPSAANPRSAPPPAPTELDRGSLAGNGDCQGESGGGAAAPSRGTLLLSSEPPTVPYQLDDVSPKQLSVPACCTSTHAHRFHPCALVQVCDARPERLADGHLAACWPFWYAFFVRGTLRQRNR
jgi:hypothetical protein